MINMQLSYTGNFPNSIKWLTTYTRNFPNSIYKQLLTTFNINEKKKNKVMAGAKKKTNVEGK